MVDVDHWNLDVIEEFLGQDLHVPGEDYEIDVAGQQLDDAGFCCGFVWPL